MHGRDEDSRGLQLWGGLECTVNRVGDRYLDQFEKGGHRDRIEDLDLVASLGIQTLRYPVLWERTAPDHPERREWGFADERMGRLRALGMEAIVGLVHHGSGPRYTSLVDEGFAAGLADHARAVAERYPWVEAYTPVNEPLTTARFSGLYGHWYPHGTDGPTYARILLNEVRATVMSMAAIRTVNPQARLVQTEDLGRTHATEPLSHQAEFENERRWVTWDLLCGAWTPITGCGGRSCTTASARTSCGGCSTARARRTWWGSTTISRASGSSTTGRTATLRTRAGTTAGRRTRTSRRCGSSPSGRTGPARWWARPGSGTACRSRSRSATWAARARSRGDGCSGSGGRRRPRGRRGPTCGR